MRWVEENGRNNQRYIHSSAQLSSVRSIILFIDAFDDKRVAFITYIWSRVAFERPEFTKFESESAISADLYLFTWLKTMLVQMKLRPLDCVCLFAHLTDLKRINKANCCLFSAISVSICTMRHMYDYVLNSFAWRVNVWEVLYKHVATYNQMYNCVTLLLNWLDSVPHTTPHHTHTFANRQTIAKSITELFRFSKVRHTMHTSVKQFRMWFFWMLLYCYQCCLVIILCGRW